ncbi:hypothetical protein LZ30DRAFT_244959 [Colletotrichum cereale]|nr:hypothetical protein LZ30DRAFT_244959 [Colletotrichum cereale]
MHGEARRGRHKTCTETSVQRLQNLKRWLAAAFVPPSRSAGSPPCQPVFSCFFFSSSSLQTGGVVCQSTTAVRRGRVTMFRKRTFLFFTQEFSSPESIRMPFLLLSFFVVVRRGYAEEQCVQGSGRIVTGNRCVPLEPRHLQLHTQPPPPPDFLQWESADPPSACLPRLPTLVPMSCETVF